MGKNSEIETEYAKGLAQTEIRLDVLSEALALGESPTKEDFSTALYGAARYPEVKIPKNVLIHIADLLSHSTDRGGAHKREYLKKYLPRIDEMFVDLTAPPSREDQIYDSFMKYRKMGETAEKARKKVMNQGFHMSHRHMQRIISHKKRERQQQKKEPHAT